MARGNVANKHNGEGVTIRVVVTSGNEEISSKVIAGMSTAEEAVRASDQIAKYGTAITKSTAIDTLAVNR